MTVIKNQKSNTYEVRTYYKDWTGVRKQKTKRGFKRKCDAQEWERAFKLKENLSLDMYFEDFVDLYLNDIKSRIKYNTWLTKKHIVEKKILPYFSKKKLQEIKPSDIRQWQNTMMNYRNKQGEPDIRGGSDSESESIDGDNMLFIKPDEANAIILKKGVAVTGYGIVEGKLHIQVRFSDILNTDNHGYVYLKNEDGKVVNCQSSVAFWDQSHVNSYEEFVFEVSAEELVNYEIWGEFWTCNNAPIEGEWQVTFPVEKNE